MACNACDSTEIRERYVLEERMFGTGEYFEYLECAECGSLSIAKVPEDLGRYYPDRYYSLGDPDLGSHLKRSLAQLRAHIWRRYPRITQQRWIPKKLNLSQLQSWFRTFPVNEAILDVGSGRGNSLVRLYQSGYRNLVGVDRFVAADETVAPGFEIRRGEVSDVAETFRLVTINHALEHVEEPLATLKQIREKLTRDGTLVVRVPVMGKAAWREYGTSWIQLDPPRHLTVFTEAGIAALALRAGLQLDRVEYDSTAFQFWASELAKRSVALIDGSPTMFSSAELTEFEQRAERLNLERDGDQAAFVLSLSS